MFTSLTFRQWYAFVLHRLISIQYVCDQHVMRAKLVCMVCLTVGQFNGMECCCKVHLTMHRQNTLPIYHGGVHCTI